MLSIPTPLRILTLLVLATTGINAQEFPALTSMISGNGQGGSNPLTFIPPPEGTKTTATGPTPIGTSTSMIYSSPTAAAGYRVWGGEVIQGGGGYLAMAAGAALGGLAFAQ
ncbi:MAG: hypothetical protein DHS80DRAFT_29605 [Piptocephalis tieghemiana]|nr:MAG: hypothetical protein DHS80DRAFT_29605 [Piptocephalis tieghemiana]